VREILASAFWVILAVWFENIAWPQPAGSDIYRVQIISPPATYLYVQDICVGMEQADVLVCKGEVIEAGISVGRILYIYTGEDIIISLTYERNFYLCNKTIYGVDIDSPEILKVPNIAYDKISYISLEGPLDVEIFLLSARICPNVKFLRLVAPEDKDLQHLNVFPYLTHLDLAGQDITDKGLEHLVRLYNLSYLRLGCTHISSTGLEHLKTLQNINALFLENTKVNDKGLEHLKQLRKLAYLSLGGTQVTDKGLDSLSTLENLALLDLSYTKVTDAGIKKIQKLLPECKIIFEIYK
jgi:predicted outer membrane lipoprotein